MSKIKLLDCTLRDGAYIVEGNFGFEQIKGIIKKLDDANIDIIECGWLKDKDYSLDFSYYHFPKDIEKVLVNKNKNKMFCAMIDYNRYDVDNLAPYDGKSIDAIRIAFPHGAIKEAKEVAYKIKEKGYKVFFQAANSMFYTEDELKNLCEVSNKLMPFGVSIVDTFGVMYKDDLERIVKVVDKYLDKNITLGFHSHNNLQLSFALVMEFIKMVKDREIVIDASLYGMGRGAGNLNLELIANYLNKNYKTDYDLDSIMDALDMYMEDYKKNYSWGYSIPFFISGTYGSHVNNIAYLLKNHRTTAKDMRNIIESMDKNDRIKYDYDLLEQKYIENQNHQVDDQKDLDDLKDLFKDRKVLIIAPGKNAKEEINKIKDFISKENPIIIGANVFLDGYNYDYMFFMNKKRYEHFKFTRENEFDKVKKIISSSINTKKEKDEYIINFNSLIKRGFDHFDNAVICLLRFLDKINVKSVYLCGFDGFKNSFNENYADVDIPNVKDNDSWNKINDDIRKMFMDFSETSNNIKEINFLTDSIFK